MRTGPLIFLVILIAIVLWIIKDRSGSNYRDHTVKYHLFMMFGWIVFKWFLLNVAMVGSLLLLHDFIHIPVTFENVCKIATALFLPYVAFNITLNLKNS